MNDVPVPHRRFAFDTVFEDGGRVITAPRPKRAYTPEEVEAERARAFADGEASAVARAQQAQAEALRQIADMARGALSTLTAVAHEHRSGAARLALAAAGRVADAALMAFPHAPLAAAMDALAREVEAVPKLVVRAAPGEVAGVAAALEQAAASAGYPGQIVVRPDAAQPPAAFVLDWGDGSAAFNPQQAAVRVAAAMETALAAEGLHAEPLVPLTASAQSEA